VSGRQSDRDQEQRKRVFHPRICSRKGPKAQRKSRKESTQGNRCVLLCVFAPLRENSLRFLPHCYLKIPSSLAFDVCYDLADSNIFSLLCAPIEQFNDALGDLFPNRDPVWNADKIRIFEFHARALVAIVQQHFETRALE